MMIDEALRSTTAHPVPRAGPSRATHGARAPGRRARRWRTRPRARDAGGVAGHRVVGAVGRLARRDRRLRDRCAGRRLARRLRAPRARLPGGAPRSGRAGGSGSASCTGGPRRWCGGRSSSSSAPPSGSVPRPARLPRSPRHPVPTSSAVSVAADDLGWVVTTPRGVRRPGRRRPSTPERTAGTDRGAPTHRRRRGTRTRRAGGARDSAGDRTPAATPVAGARTGRTAPPPPPAPPTAADSGRVVVAAGDSLWAIAARHLGPDATDARDRRVLAAVVPRQRGRHRSRSRPDRPRSGSSRRPSRRTGHRHDRRRRRAGAVERGGRVRPGARRPAASGGQTSDPSGRGSGQGTRPAGHRSRTARRTDDRRADLGPARARDVGRDRRRGRARARSRRPTPPPSGCSIALAALEVLAGRRPVAQLARWLAPGRLRGRPGAQRPDRARPAYTRRARDDRWSDGSGSRPSTTTAHEVSVVTDDAGRVRAVALRLEAHRGAWRATALEIG